jgi:hypothetical protein
MSFPKVDIVAAMDHPGIFRPWFPGASWDGWRAVLKATTALPMSEAEVEFFRSVALAAARHRARGRARPGTSSGDAAAKTRSPA